MAQSCRTWSRLREMTNDSRERRLNLGSGRTYDAGWTNLDITPATDPDVVHNLDVTPWPFDDDQFQHVRMIDVLEHLRDPFTALLELHRVCDDGARIDVVVPHFSAANAYTDPTHKSFWSYYSLDVVTGEHSHDYYTELRYRMAHRHIEFYKDPISKVVARLAACNPRRYEQRWAWTFPAWFLVFELEVLKR